MAGMTFYVGNTKLSDGSAIKHERQNLRPGDPVLTKDGGTLPNGTYTDAAGKSFTVSNGKVGQINVIIPIETPIIDVPAETPAETPAAEPLTVEPVKPVADPIVEPPVSDPVKTIIEPVADPVVISTESK